MMHILMFIYNTLEKEHATILWCEQLGSTGQDKWGGSHAAKLLLDRGIFGANLKDLVIGDMELAFVSNFMVDMPWLMSALPALARARLLIVAHGEQPCVLLTLN